MRLTEYSLLPTTDFMWCVPGDGMHGSRCGCIGAQRTKYCRREIPEVGRLAGIASAGAWHHTLGMSTLSVDSAASARILYQDLRPQRQHSAHVQAISFTVSQSRRCPNAKQGLCNNRVSVCPSIVSPSFCLSVCPIDRQQQLRVVGLLLSTPPGRKKAYRSKAAGSGVAYQLSIGISWRRPCSAAHAGSVMLRADGRGSTHTCSSLQRALHYSNLSSLTRTYMLDQKTAHQTHGHNSVKFQNSFSKSLCSKFAAKWLLMISPHFACYCTTSWNITVRKQAINDKLKLV